MQDYIHEYQPGFTNLKTVKPNAHKVFIRNMLSALGIAAGIVGLLIYLQIQVGLDVFLIPMETLGMHPDPTGIMVDMIILFVVCVAIFLVFDYLTVMNLRYEFYSDHMKLYSPVLWIFVTHSEIPYKNIVKISYNYTGFTNKLLNSGEIIIDVTGMREGFVKMEVIDDTENVVEQLLKIVKEYNAVKQMQFEENYKLNNIMKKF